MFSHGILFIAMPKEAVMENHFIWEKKQEREYKALKLQMEWCSWWHLRLILVD
ncbi:hypothetical protein JHK87_045762 [Glycine soja]|nr:hypothetical protein JHK87_045762 [Glycine soja]